MCLRSQYRRCGIRVIVEDAQVMDRVCLRPCGGCSCWSRLLLCSGESFFAGLFPDSYLLKLQRRGCRPMEGVLCLPPGGNVEVYCEMGRGAWSWKRDVFHGGFNRVRCHGE